MNRCPNKTGDMLVVVKGSVKPATSFRWADNWKIILSRSTLLRFLVKYCIRSSFEKFLASPIVKRRKWTFLLWQHVTTSYQGIKINLDFRYWRTIGEHSTRVGRVFANGLRDLGLIPGHVMSKTLKMVLDVSLLNTQQYKVSIKGNVEQSRERCSALSYTSV